ncbi:MAG: outer membrane beta-barrel protein [Gammaproteobacteria bacterium]
MRTNTMVWLAALGLMPGLAAAQELSYDWVELAYVDTELDVDGPGGGFDVDGDGFAVGGSFSLTDAFQVIASYTDLDFDFDVDTTAFAIGAGYRYGISENADLVASLSYVSGEVDTNFGDADDNGFSLAAGFRGFVADQVELEGGVSYTDLDESGDETALFGEGRYWFNDEFAAGAGIAFSDDATALMISGRYSFGANLNR